MQGAQILRNTKNAGSALPSRAARIQQGGDGSATQKSAFYEAVKQDAEYLKPNLVSGRTLFGK